MRITLRMACGAVVVLLATAASGVAQTAFTSPSEASAALAEAARADDMNRLRAIMGVAGRKIVSSGDAVADMADRRRFAAAYDSRHSVVQKGDTANGKMYYIGAKVTYTLAGETTTVDVTPDYVVVRPQPLLVLTFSVLLPDKSILVSWKGPIA